jgi:RNA polymerase-binding transcription factor DksA
MATPRKSRAAPSKRKPASPARRPAAVAKKAKPAEHRAAAKAAAAPGAKGTVRAAGAKGTRPVGAAVGAKARSGKRSPAPPAPVRPLGVLPRESRARTVERPAAPVAVKPVAAVKKGEARPEPAGVQPLTAKDLKHFEELLKTELQKIRKEMGHLETTVLKVNPRDSSGDLSGYSFHMADAGTDAMEREKAFLFASVEGRKEREIHDALQRIYDGTYGICENCGNPIARARLEAVPYVRLCVSCKQKEEQASRSQPG